MAEIRPFPRPALRRDRPLGADLPAVRRHLAGGAAAPVRAQPLQRRAAGVRRDGAGRHAVARIATRARRRRCGSGPERGVLVRDESPSFYVYDQEFDARRAALCRGGRCSPASACTTGTKGPIRPHEHTLSRPKEDRLQLLRACRLNISPILALYRDDDARVRRTLSRRPAAMRRCWRRRTSTAKSHRVSRVDGGATSRTADAVVSGEDVLRRRRAPPLRDGAGLSEGASLAGAGVDGRGAGELRADGAGCARGPGACRAADAPLAERRDGSPTTSSRAWSATSRSRRVDDAADGGRLRSRLADAGERAGRLRVRDERAQRSHPPRPRRRRLSRTHAAGLPPLPGARSTRPSCRRSCCAASSGSTSRAPPRTARWRSPTTARRRCDSVESRALRLAFLLIPRLSSACWRWRTPASGCRRSRLISTPSCLPGWS